MCLYNILKFGKIQYKKEVFIIKSYKQILIICGLLVTIIVGVILYFQINNNQDDYSYLEIENVENEKTNIIEKEIVENYIVVHVTGEVINPGIVRVKDTSRIIDVIEAAGGTTQEADLSKINLAYVVEDGIKIYVPSIKDEEVNEYVTSDSGKGVIENDKSNNSSSNNTLRININTATSEELQKIPGIGQAIANRIISYRNENGKFSNIEELKNVSGIGDSKFNNIKEYIYVK